MPKTNRPILMRFLDKIDFNTPSGCWVWTAATDGRGYGAFGTGGKLGEIEKAHRWSLMHIAGKTIPPGMHTDHLCRNTRCVNPDHLEVVTPGENLRRSPYSNASKTHCKYGHELTEDNVYLIKKNKKNGGTRTERWCKICQRKRTLERYHRLKAVQ